MTLDEVKKIARLIEVAEECQGNPVTLEREANLLFPQFLFEREKSKNYLIRNWDVKVRYLSPE